VHRTGGAISEQPDEARKVDLRMQRSHGAGNRRHGGVGVEAAALATAAARAARIDEEVADLASSAPVAVPGARCIVVVVVTHGMLWPSRYVMPAAEAIRLLGCLSEHGVDICVGGGWCVDALLGEQTRDHSDLDLWLGAAALEGLFRLFAAEDLDRIHPWPGDRPWNFVLHDGRTRRIDLHLYETIGDGNIQYGSIRNPLVMPETALSHEGVISCAVVRCEEPSWAVSFHTGYVLRPSDRHDVTRLCDRYGIELPAEYR
jgi:lincosamide nucleotidyltransferase A/C/D/E